MKSVLQWFWGLIGYGAVATIVLDIGTWPYECANTLACAMKNQCREEMLVFKGSQRKAKATGS